MVDRLNIFTDDKKKERKYRICIGHGYCDNYDIIFSSYSTIAFVLEMEFKFLNVNLTTLLISERLCY